MQNTLQNIGLEQIMKFLPSGNEIRMGDDLYIVDVDKFETDTYIDSPFRVDAFLVFFCEKGGFDIEINLKQFSIEDNTLLICIPGNILKLGKSEDSKAIPGRMVAMAVSRRFISEIKFDFSKLFESRIMFFYEPRIILKQEEMSFCSKYFYLVKTILESNVPEKSAAVGALVESLLHVLAGLVDVKKKEIETTAPKSSYTRLNMLFERFMSLVSEHHTKERGMAFYARHLGISPKYLSRLIKQVSGRSAPDWIDSFVIQEAKSMLKYTDDTIKEIVYKLNFVNASVFYKFFKSKTGLTPKEYRNNGS